MKIVLFPSSYPPVGGGVQEVAFRLAKEFEKKGHDVTVITQRYPRRLKRTETIEGIRVNRILFPNLVPSGFGISIWVKYALGLILAPFSFLRLLWLLKREKPEAVYVHFVGIGSLYLLASRPFVNFRLIVTLHGDDVEGLPFRNRFNRWLLEKVCTSADFITACSTDLLKKGREICPLIRQKSMAIHNGLNLEDYQEIKRFEHRVPYIFAAGRFEQKKGFDVVIKAFRLLREKGCGHDLVIAGDGPELENCMRLAERLAIPYSPPGERALHGRQSIAFWGWATREMMRSLLAGSQLLVVPSRREPFGLVVLEGLASGTAVVASNVGGIPEILSNGCGLLVPPGDEVVLAEAMERVVRDKDMRETMVTAGKKRAQDFSWENVAMTYLNLSGSNQPPR